MRETPVDFRSRLRLRGFGIGDIHSCPAAARIRDKFRKTRRSFHTDRTSSNPLRTRRENGRYHLVRARRTSRRSTQWEKGVRRSSYWSHGDWAIRWRDLSGLEAGRSDHSTIPAKGAFDRLNARPAVLGNERSRRCQGDGLCREKGEVVVATFKCWHGLAASQPLSSKTFDPSGTAALSPSVTYIIPIIASPLSAGLSVSGCVLRSDAMLATACVRSPRGC